MDQVLVNAFSGIIIKKKRCRRLKSNSSPEVWLEKRVSYSVVPCLLSLNSSRKSGFKRKIMLFLLVTGAGGLSVGISLVPQHILLMPQYKLDYQRSL